MLDIKLLESPHPFSANCYLISADGEYAIIDPTAPYDKELINGRLKYILLTHAHFDHILDIDSWVENTDAKVVALCEEADALSDPMRNCYKLYDGTDRGYFGEVMQVKDGDIIPLGDSQVRIIACPGHTIGCVTYYIDSVAFVGDTVFEGGGFGRYDLPTGNFVMLRQSILRLMTVLPDDTLLYPGHGGTTTVKEYKKHLIIK